MLLVRGVSKTIGCILCPGRQFLLPATGHFKSTTGDSSCTFSCNPSCVSIMQSLLVVLQQLNFAQGTRSNQNVHRLVSGETVKTSRVVRASASAYALPL
eukprot:567049-Pleurochrysis_carterae.AAC.1